MVHVGKQHRLGEERLVVLTGAAITVPTCSDLKVERTVYPAKDRKVSGMCKLVAGEGEKEALLKVLRGIRGAFEEGA